MAEVRKLKAVKSLVRPDRRDEYLESWKKYARAAEQTGAQVWLFEDQALPGRFLEFTEHMAASGMEAQLDLALQRAELRGPCVRREGEDVLYREVVLEDDS
jgi:hypothetical protein